MTKVNWESVLQIFLVLPTSWLLHLYLLGATFGGLVAIPLHLLANDLTTYEKALAFQHDCSILFPALGGTLGLTSLWVVIVKGRDALVPSLLRRLTILGLFSGISAVAYGFYYFLYLSPRPSAVEAREILFVAYILCAPLIPGLVFFYRLYSASRAAPSPGDVGF